MSSHPVAETVDEALDVGASHLGQPASQLGTVVVAVDADQPSRSLARRVGQTDEERVEQGRFHPVAGVDDGVGPIHLRPDTSGQVAGAVGNVGIGDQ